MPTAKPRIGTTCDKGLFRWAMAAAFAEKRSLSQLCSKALEDYLKCHHEHLNPDKQPSQLGFCADLPEVTYEFI
jgi:hypothetical protein